MRDCIRAFIPQASELVVGLAIEILCGMIGDTVYGRSKLITALVGLMFGLIGSAASI